MNLSSHDAKYHQIAKTFGIKLSNNFMGRTKSQWVKLYAEDKHLNNVSLSEWDHYAICIRSLWQQYQQTQKGFPFWSLSQGVCLYKFLVKRDIVNEK